MKGKPTLKFVPWSKIHQPLPRTPRQSEQLLNALTSSFRRQLDQEHPSSTPPSERQGNGNSLSENLNSSVHATDDHLRNILDNPLFRVAPRKHPPAESRIYTEPMVIFDELAASGSVTPKALRRCLQSQLSLLASRHTGSALIKAMNESQTGSKIKNWWFASDSDTRKHLFRSEMGSRAAVKFMVAEGLQNVFPAWLDFLAKHSPGKAKPSDLPWNIALRAYSVLLCEIISFEIEHGGGLPAALQHYLQATKLIEIRELPDSFRYPALRSATETLHNSMLEHAKEIPTAAFDEFLDVTSAMFPESYFGSSLPLYHPTQANPTPFVEYLNRFPPDRLGEMSTPQQASLMQHGFDALRILRDQDRSQDISVVERFLQQVLSALKDGEARPLDRVWSTSEEQLVARVGARVGLTLT